MTKNKTSRFTFILAILALIFMFLGLLIAWGVTYLPLIIQSFETPYPMASITPTNIALSTPTFTSIDTPTSTNTPTNTPTLTHTPTVTPTAIIATVVITVVVTNTPMPETTTPTGTSTPTATSSNEFNPPTATPKNTPTFVIPTLTPLTLQPAITIDDHETQPDRTATGDSFRLLRWRPWTGEGTEGWYYLIRFLPASDGNSVYYIVNVPQSQAYTGTGENAGWLTYSFDINKLPRDNRSCYPYWDVVVAIDADQVDCPAGQLDWQGVCRLSAFSSNQQNLATSPPGMTCTGGSGSRGGSEKGSGGGGGPLPN